MSKLIFMMRYALKKYRSLVCVVVLQNIFKAILPLLNVVGLGLVVNSLVSGGSSKNILSIILLYLIVNLGISIVESLLSYLQFVQTRKASNTMQFEYAEDSLHINYHYIQDGKLINLKQKAMSANPSIYMTQFGNILNQLLQLVGILYILTRLSPIFISILILTCAGSVLSTFKNRNIEFEFKNARIESDRKIEYLYKVMSEYRYAKDVRINDSASFISDKFKNVVTEHLRRLKDYYLKQKNFRILNVIIIVVQSAAMYLYFTYQVYITQITIAEYTVLISTTTLLTSVILSLFDNIAQVRNLCKNIDYYLKYTETVKINSTIAKSEDFSEVKVDFTLPTIRFENVSFTYPGTDVTVLKNINFEIKSGERIGLVGLNGSGKTTLVKLLTRLYDPDDGRITINNIDIKDIPYHQYNANIGVVLQDFALFAYSVRENLTFSKECDDKTLIKYLSQSGLEGKILSLKNGLDTSIYRQLDDDGIEFSGGEGQKLALARALFKNASILILDEPTSALDPVAEYELFNRLNSIAKGKNALFISHRLSSTRFCDKIIVIQNGEITDSGSHDELMSKNGFYGDLFNTQASYYLESEVTA
jgi:ABC-type multidrug transport system fused ATPase/permease subunit